MMSDRLMAPAGAHLIGADLLASGVIFYRTLLPVQDRDPLASRIAGVGNWTANNRIKPVHYSRIACASRPLRSVTLQVCHDQVPKLKPSNIDLIPSQSAKMKSLGQKELDDIYAFAVALGKEAGTILMNGVKLRMDGGAPEQVVEKENAVDIVTKTDEGKLDGPQVSQKVVASLTIYRH
jgi:hypothetical protein